MKKSKRREAMGRRQIKTADENDAYTGWKRVLCYMARPGVSKKVKRRTHKRERKEWRKDL